MSFQTAFADDAAAIRDHINRGNALLARKQFQEAISEYEAVLQIQPDYPIAKSNIALTHNNWGILLYSQHKYAEAKEQWETALKLNPRDGHVVRNLKIVEAALARNPQPEQTTPTNPKPSGPQDWNPFDESLDNIPKKNTNAASDTPPAAVASPSGSPSSGTAAATVSTANSSAATAKNETTSQPSGPVIILGGASSVQTSNGTENTTESGSRDAGTMPRAQSTTNSSPVTSEDPFSSPSTEPTPPSNKPNFNTVDSSTNSVRIVGGTSGGATIVGGSTVSGGGKSFTPSTTTNTTPPSFVPAKVPPKPAGGSTPMSWPGADEEHAPMIGKPARTPNSTKIDKHHERTAQDDSLNVESLLEEIEIKLYGKVSKNQPILKRIEKLEVDTLGKKKSGPIADRLKELKETYGL
ncbi:tetratricopeptide repeat protein [Candidatus Obscuribacterales bacterium]|nr:tetratricopeptide repeat protein [Candidatus Obscuribacterales bacterium]